MSSKKPKQSSAKPRSRFGYDPKQRKAISLVEWLPLVILLALGSAIWGGCRHTVKRQDDETYRGPSSITLPPMPAQKRPAGSSNTGVSKPVTPSAQGKLTGGSSVPVSEPGALDIQVPALPAKDDSKTRSPLPKEPAKTEYHPPTALPSDEVSTVPGAKGMIALTFDAGASAEPVVDILKALADSGSYATFFLTGKWVKKNPEAAKKIVAAGHEIANHSWSHPDFTTLSDDEILDQLNQTQQTFKKQLGTPGAALFRPPFGARNDNVRSMVCSQGYRIIYWAVDCLDSVKKGITAEQIKTRVLARSGSGDIVLMHCGSQPTADALPSLIASLNKKGLRLVTVGELLQHE